MSYIGKTPAVGNFVKLDAITTSSTNTYNLTVDSVAFVPESANHMLVSLNGVIQAPLSSFSVSGSTITFIPASGTLSSSDSIDFIMVYGNVLDIGTPSDSTVTNAKTNFVSTSGSAGLQIKGDGTTDGTLQLNCSQNSHGIKLRSPSHSASASYTLTFPTTDGNADEFLKTDGSGVLSWAGAGGGVLQCKFGTHSVSQYGSTSTSYVDVGSDYQVTITPSSSSNYILVYCQFANQHTASGQRTYYTINKTGDSSNNGDQHGNLNVSADSLANTESIYGGNDYTTFVYMDKNVNSTNALTYKLRYKVGSGTTYVGSANSGNYMMAIELDGGIF